MIITVTGRHRATHAPQSATLSLRIAVEADEAAASLRGLEEASAPTLEELAGASGMPAAPVRAHTVSATSTRSWRPWGPDGEQLDPRVEAAVEVTATFDDLEAVAPWSARWGAREHCTLVSVAWDLEPATRTELEARTLTAAVRDARHRAETIAGAAGAGPVAFLEVADPGLLPHTSGPDEHGPALGAKAFAADAGQGVPTAPEDVVVESHVHVRFQA